MDSLDIYCYNSKQTMLSLFPKLHVRSCWLRNFQASDQESSSDSSGTSNLSVFIISECPAHFHL